MNQLLKWTFLFAALMMVIKPGHTFTIGIKNSIAGGPIVHSTYFLTNSNASFDVHGEVYAGTTVNSFCLYNQIYDIGMERLQTGDTIYIDGFKLKSLIGPTANCVTVRYTLNQMVYETYQIIYDGINYVYSDPYYTEVTIL